ncbi:MAG: hypothetical protein QWI73_06455 [Alphaproteobacteria bacterium]|nr:hypothetical protein [Alphaproteobacteria bacterium]
MSKERERNLFTAALAADTLSAVLASKKQRGKLSKLTNYINRKKKKEPEEERIISEAAADDDGSGGRGGGGSSNGGDRGGGGGCFDGCCGSSGRDDHHARLTDRPTGNGSSSSRNEGIIFVRPLQQKTL